MNKKIFMPLDPEMEIGFRENRFGRKMYPERNVHYIAASTPNSNLTPIRSRFNYLYEEPKFLPQLQDNETGSWISNSYFGSKSVYEKNENQLNNIREEASPTGLKPVRKIRIIRSNNNMPTINNNKLSRIDSSSNFTNNSQNDKSLQASSNNEPFATHSNGFKINAKDSASLSPSRFRRDVSKQILKHQENHRYDINMLNSKLDYSSASSKTPTRDRSPFHNAAKNLITKELFG
ncbi:unnamed protein product [Blepharisma stoltei]|uniref:Uncharacterized protein n=1 Tax=Blepharisma stoltei TaxID=1481888 RepID=A0AAU9IU77_9CILI|nr:unnamed protein product [Blepharisma stoltei]